MARYTKIESEEMLAPLFDAAHSGAVMLFKHSLTCPISGAAFRQYEQYLAELEDDGVTHYLVEIQNARPVSNRIAELSGVRHESPQAILLRAGTVDWHASHWQITRDALSSAIGG